MKNNHYFFILIKIYVVLVTLCFIPNSLADITVQLTPLPAECNKHSYSASRCSYPFNSTESLQRQENQLSHPTVITYDKLDVTESELSTADFSGAISANISPDSRLLTDNLFAVSHLDLTNDNVRFYNKYDDLNITDPLDIYANKSDIDTDEGSLFDHFILGSSGEALFRLTTPAQEDDVTNQYTLKLWDDRVWQSVPLNSPLLSHSTQAAISSALINPTVIQNVVNTIHDQLGKQTPGNSLTVGLGRSKIKFNNNDNINFNQDLRVVTLNYGKTIDLDDDSLLILGIYTGYGDSDVNLKNYGSGNIQLYSAAGYTKYEEANGFYSDAILMFNYSNHSIYASIPPFLHINDKYDLFASGLSLRSGVNFKLSAVTLQPYVGVRGIVVNKHNYQFSNGIMVKLAEAHSLVASLGLKAKRKFAFDLLKFDMVMNIIHEREFVDDNHVTVNHQKYTSDPSDAWYKYSVGVKTPLYQIISLNLSYEVTRGKHTKSPGEFGLQIDIDF